jgi:hypothetical protein
MALVGWLGNAVWVGAVISVVLEPVIRVRELDKLAEDATVTFFRPYGCGVLVAFETSPIPVDALGFPGAKS